MNKPFNFLNLDRRSETDIMIRIFIRKNSIEDIKFTMKSLILAQDER